MHFSADVVRVYGFTVCACIQIDMGVHRHRALCSPNKLGRLV